MKNLFVLFAVQILFTNCFIYNSVTSFDTVITSRKEMPNLPQGNIGVIFDNRLRKYQFYDEQWITNTVDNKFKKVFENRYIPISESRKKISLTMTEDALRSLHGYDDLMLKSQSKTLDHIRTAAGIDYLIVLHIDEYFRKHQYDYGYYGFGFISGKEGGYGRAMVFSMNFIDLKKYELYSSRMSLAMESENQGPSYKSYISSFTSKLSSSIQGKMK